MKSLISLLLLLVLCCPIATAQESIRIPVQDYNISATEDINNPKWSELRLPRRDATVYELIDSMEDSVYHIRAVANNSASGLVYKVDIDPNEFPILEWSWKINGTLPNGDFRKKEGDDYAARIYITFDYNKRKLKFGERVKYETFRTFSRFPIPLRALNYIWANKAPTGTIAPNAYTNWVYMVAVESGDEKSGMWQVQTQNIYEDYLTAFGEEPPNISGIAIMSDSDNTGGSAEALYGDIIFKSDF